MNAFTGKDRSLLVYKITQNYPMEEPYPDKKIPGTMKFRGFGYLGLTII